MQNQNIDHGNKFDWGKTSADYARFRDIYPPQFYEMILNRNCGAAGQRVLDVGTGTGVLPRNLYAAGAHWTGCDIAPNQIAQAKQLSQGMKVAYLVSTAETLPTFAEPFDWITACQCYWYFDVAKTAPAFARVLKSGGKVLLLCMQWLPYEDPIAHASEELVLQYNPNWSGAGERKHPIAIAEEWLDDFTVTHQMEIDLDVPFTRESWNGRMKACRGIGASLPPEKIALEQVYPLCYEDMGFFSENGSHRKRGEDFLKEAPQLLQDYEAQHGKVLRERYSPEEWDWFRQAAD